MKGDVLPARTGFAIETIVGHLIKNSDISVRRPVIEKNPL